MKSIQIREITTTGKASVIVINPYFVRNLVFNLIKLQNFAQFLREYKAVDDTGAPVFDREGSSSVRDEYLSDIYNSVLPFLQQIDDAIIDKEDNLPTAAPSGAE